MLLIQYLQVMKVLLRSSLRLWNGSLDEILSLLFFSSFSIAFAHFLKKDQKEVFPFEVLLWNAFTLGYHRIAMMSHCDCQRQKKKYTRIFWWFHQEKVYVFTIRSEFKSTQLSSSCRVIWDEELRILLILSWAWEESKRSWWNSEKVPLNLKSLFLLRNASTSTSLPSSEFEINNRRDKLRNLIPAMMLLSLEDFQIGEISQNWRIQTCKFDGEQWTLRGKDIHIILNLFESLFT